VREWIEVKESTGKGLGVFATTDIPCGARVLAEEPLLRRDEENGSSIDILSAFEKLSVSQKNSYLQLRGFAGAAFKRAAEDETGRAWQAMSPMERKILTIWAANTFGHVFLLGSRFNHSCIPNINFAYNPDLDKETFHAVRNITAGEELTITYIDGMNRTRKQRQVELDKRGFICDCPACENTKEGETREKKRAQMLDLDQALAIQMRLRTSAAWSQATRLTQRLAAIQRSEGLLTRPLGITSVHQSSPPIESDSILDIMTLLRSV
jgi:hypothetical protein